MEHQAQMDEMDNWDQRDRTVHKATLGPVDCQVPQGPLDYPVRLGPPALQERVPALPAVEISLVWVMIW